jgi:NADH-quinone oxidoreductase subunit E
MDRAALEKIVSQWKDQPGNLIMILHAVQGVCGYVPRDVTLMLQDMLDVPMARMYEVITFYHYFKLEAPGKHRVSVCMGTACYLKGAADVLDEYKRLLKVEEGGTTADGQFTLETVRCVGCCGLAPVIVIDDKTYGKMKAADSSRILSEFIKGIN